jgi:hypothetical protein
MLRSLGSKKDPMSIFFAKASVPDQLTDINYISLASALRTGGALILICRPLKVDQSLSF